jgi:hypothetical protein
MERKKSHDERLADVNLGTGSEMEKVHRRLQKG